jgi:hypothetical protein
MKLGALRFAGVTTDFPGGKIDNRMATEGHMRGGKKNQRMTRRQCRLLRRELRHAENLNIPEEENRVQMCEPETGRGLNDEEDELGSDEDLKHCQEGREEIPNCQVGKELRLLQDLTD